MVISTVWPSLGASSTAIVPSDPPPPARFTTATGWPSAAPNGSANSRAITSVEPPAGQVTISVIGFEG